jgi:predicted dehydrogenase
MATGVHCVDTMRFVTGQEVTEVAAISDATTDHPLEELLTLSLRFADGSLGTVITGRRTPDYIGNDLMVYGSLGRGGVRGSMDTTLTGTLDVQTEALTLDEAYAPDPVSMYTAQVDAFNRAVIEGGEPAATGVDGLRAAEITAAMVESARSGRRVRL